VVRLKRKDGEAGPVDEPRAELPIAPDEGEAPEVDESEY